MLIIYVLGFSLILESYGRQPLGPSPGLTIYRTATPGQYLVQPTPRTTNPEIPQGYPQIALVVVPRHPEPILHTTLLPRIASEHPEDGFDRDSRLYYRQVVDIQDSIHHIIKPQPFVFAQLLPYPPTKKKLYPKQKIPIRQFLKEVIPTTKTVYSEQQAASLRYAQATSPPEEEEPQKLVPQRVVLQAFSIPYIIQSETQTDPHQSQPYQQIFHQPHLIQNQENVQPQQFVQSQPLRGESAAQQAKYQQSSAQPQSTHDGLTYIPVNPVMFQKPLVDDDTPVPKSAIYVTQKTAIKKYQSPQPVSEEDAEENLDKAQTLPRKENRQPQLRQYFAVQPQQYLVPLFPQPQQHQQQLQELQQQPTHLNDELQNQLPPQVLKYQQIQPLQQEPLKYQQVQPQPIFQQPLFIQFRSKKVPSQILTQQPQQPGIVAYHQFPLQQPLQGEAYADHRAYHLQPTEHANSPKHSPIRVLFQPQLLAYQNVQPVNIRQQTRLQQVQPEQLSYEHPQEDSAQEQHIEQEAERNEEKQQDVHLQETPQRHSAKYKKSQLRSRKYRPSPARVLPENEEESQNDAQDNQQENQDDFRVQYQDGLKPQATTYAGLRYRRPLQTNSRHSSRSKDRAVQIIDEDDEEYK